MMLHHSRRMTWNVVRTGCKPTPDMRNVYRFGPTVYRVSCLPLPAGAFLLIAAMPRYPSTISGAQ